MVSVVEQVRAAKDLVAAQTIYDKASFGWYGFVYQVEHPEIAVDVNRVGIDWYPQANSGRTLLSERMVDVFSPTLLSALERAEELLVESYMASKGKAVIERPKMKGPEIRAIYYAGDVIIYGRDSMICIPDGMNPYPEYKPDPVNGVFLRERWDLCMDGMYVGEFLQTGGYLWELDMYMKEKVVWLEGGLTDRFACERWEYMDFKKELGI